MRLCGFTPSRRISFPPALLLAIVARGTGRLPWVPLPAVLHFDPFNPPTVEHRNGGFINGDYQSAGRVPVLP